MPTTRTPAPRCLTCDRALPPDADPRRLTCSDACRARRYRERRSAELKRLRALVGERV